MFVALFDEENYVIKCALQNIYDIYYIKYDCIIWTKREILHKKTASAGRRTYG